MWMCGRGARLGQKVAPHFWLGLVVEGHGSSAIRVPWMVILMLESPSASPFE